MKPTPIINFVGRYLLACTVVMLLSFVAIPSSAKNDNPERTRTIIMLVTIAASLAAFWPDKDLS